MLNRSNPVGEKRRADDDMATVPAWREHFTEINWNLAPINSSQQVKKQACLSVLQAVFAKA